MVDLPIFSTDFWTTFVKANAGLDGQTTYSTQNPSFSAYTQQRVLYTWDELIMSIFQVGKPPHEFEEDLSRSYFILDFVALFYSTRPTQK